MFNARYVKQRTLNVLKWRVKVSKFYLPVVPLVLLALFLVTFSGFTDFFWEVDFSSCFKWSDIDVRDEVVKELTGQKASKNYMNDIEKFKLHSEQYKCDLNKTSLLILIKSAPDRVERRNAYRRTLSTINLHMKWKVRTLFVLGHYDNQLESVTTENKFYKDMIIGDFVDNYYNNTYKMVYSIKTAYEYCGEVPYLVSMDDDYMISIPNLIEYLNKHTKNEQLYAGYRVDSSPFRLRFQRYAISLDEYPYNLYPPYITGGLVIYTPQAVKEFYIAIKYLKLFKFDDIYAGIIAYYLGYNPQMLSTVPITRDGYEFGLKVGEHGYTADEIEQTLLGINKDVQIKQLMVL
ncbi:unnamed protein product [Bursaphelenchus okinawaensis]|uniref:Hexosyltransferase n=1 Tax=Bursaphelenchus okinawaensis TaxID=465554 RepID=A0A811LRA8_9BILA|nr:unnamed protein product [Bursaphelenchus okinawaensis]CAG9127164.1 unnamed protein product [Bursaphelenchus okinawaensis]